MILFIIKKTLLLEDRAPTWRYSGRLHSRAASPLAGRCHCSDTRYQIANPYLDSAKLKVKLEIISNFYLINNG